MIIPEPVRDVLESRVIVHDKKCRCVTGDPECVRIKAIRAFLDGTQNTPSREEVADLFDADLFDEVVFMRFRKRERDYGGDLVIHRAPDGKVVCYHSPLKGTLGVGCSICADGARIYLRGAAPTAEEPGRG